MLEHIYGAHRPILKHHGESGFILICMIAMSFDKLGLVALVKPVGSPAEPLCCNIKCLIYHLQASLYLLCIHGSSLWRWGLTPPSVLRRKPCSDYLSDHKRLMILLLIYMHLACVCSRRKLMALMVRLWSVHLLTTNVSSMQELPYNLLQP